MLNADFLAAGHWQTVLVCVLCFIFLARFMLPLSLKFLRSRGMLVLNYQERTVYNGLGLYLWILQVIYSVFVAFIVESVFYSYYTLALTFVFICGWLDDTIGDETVKGLKGHWRKWRDEKTVTTGVLKAFGIGMASFWLTAETSEFLPMVDVQTDELRQISPQHASSHFVLETLKIILKTALMTLSANAFNLLDLRPGRAMKVFIPAVLILFSVESAAESVFFLFPLLVGLLFLFPGDLRGRWMLGDTGSNLIGFAWGAAFVLFAPVWTQLFVLALLLWIHWVAEKSSLTQWIERRPVLRWLDRLGRT